MIREKFTADDGEEVELLTPETDEDEAALEGAEGLDIFKGDGED